VDSYQVFEEPNVRISEENNPENWATNSQAQKQTQSVLFLLISDSNLTQQT
jgi:hypothetical protein